MTYGSADSAPGSAGPSDGPSTAVIDLLGLLAYAELVAFFRLSDNAELAPTLVAKGELAGLAAAEYTHYKRVRDRLAELGADPEEVMAPFTEPLDAWHDRTKPQTWLESLVKAYVGDGIAGDFYREVAESADEETRALAQSVLSESGRGDFIASQVREAVERDPSLAGRLSLWARRLVGEALSQAQIVATTRVELAALLVSGAGEAEPESESGSGDLAAVSRMFAKLTDAHNARLEAMGLNG
ncbi:hypothetical protein F4561_000707 [Lipingzhangella halophila]|uniref:Ferritin-like domain-containing protein n=1 Tax=Lipingzhangella halophila TaxID=1783352 RepID=A0A7W7RD99_9ACTN|nr:ferritin-like fold-containing protein [Lipingzhangella halophila]MBB4929887.1 hypothetical protein [Lipingzhangella halophila]